MENNTSLNNTNKAFIEMLLSNKLPLKNYPERVSEDFVLYEPSSLPFGGKYVGLEEYEKFAVPKIAEYYDFSRFEFVGVYGDKNIIFAILKIGVRNTDEVLYLCEQFTFKDDKITEIRVFASNYK